MSRLRPRAVKEISTGDPGTDRVQEELARKTKDIDACPLLRGVSVSTKLRPNIPEQIAHKLGRQPQGFLVTDITEGFGPAIRRLSWDSRTITLVHGGAANLTAQLWVY